MQKNLTIEFLYHRVYALKVNTKLYGKINLYFGKRYLVSVLDVKNLSLSIKHMTLPKMLYICLFLWEEQLLLYIFVKLKY